MRTAVVVSTPDVAYGALALLRGTFEEKTRKAAAMGCDGIELMVRKPDELDWAAIQRVLAASHLAVPQVVTGELFGADGLCLVTPDAETYRQAEARLRSVIDFAAPLGAYVNIGRVRGRLDWMPLPHGAWDVAVERLRSVCDYASSRGVRLTLEPINRYETDFIFTVGDGLRMIEDLARDNVGLMLDLFHMNIEEPSIEESLVLAGDRLWHIHIADSNRRYPGSGHTPLDSVFATLRKIGYAGYISGELLPLPDGDTAAEKTVQWLHAHISGTVA